MSVATARGRRALVLTATGAAVLALAAPAVAATDPASPPVFTKTAVDTAITGAAFSVTGNVNGDVRPEIVAGGYGAFTFIPGVPAPIPPAAGTVSLYTNAAKNKQGGDIDSWTKTPIVTVADGITFPNKPTLADVDGDGDTDVVVPGGYFFDTFLGLSRGSITWWENRANGGTWIRHDVVTGSPFSYHGVSVADIDGDGIDDLVTVGEQGGNPSDANDDVVELQVARGLGLGDFAAPVKVADGGGSLPVVSDVDGDGDRDIVSAQYFGPVGGQPFVPSFARGASVASFVWFEYAEDGDGVLSTGDFTRRAIGTAQGPSFQIIPVANFRGDGVTRWIGTNHTNKNIAFPPFSLYPEPAVYEFTPGADPRAPWSVVKLSSANAFPVTGGVGQAAPGGVAPADLDGDGDLDLAVSGDGSRTLYWLEQRADGTFPVATLPNAANWGQAGIAANDLNRDGAAEIIAASFDRNSVGIWQR